MQQTDLSFEPSQAVSVGPLTANIKSEVDLMVTAIVC